MSERKVCLDFVDIGAAVVLYFVLLFTALSGVNQIRDDICRYHYPECIMGVDR